LALKRGEDKKIQPRVALRWSDTYGVDAVNLASHADLNSNLFWYRGKHVIAKSQDQCKVGAWVYAQSPLSVSPIPFPIIHYLITPTSDQNTTAEPPITGRIIDILQDTGGKTSLVILDVFQVAAVRHEIFGMPILKRRLNEKTVLVISATVRNV